MMRTSATVLERFRLWREPEQEWLTEADLQQSILGTFAGNAQTAMGQAFGRILEDPERYAVPSPLGLGIQGYECNGRYFHVDQIQAHIDLFDRRGVFEAKGETTYGDIVVVAKADQLCGAQLVENKIRFSPLDFDGYHNSFQWRFMVDIFNPRWVTYHVWEFRVNDAGIPTISDPHDFNFFPYQALHQDCADLVEEFRDYVMLRQLDGVLRQKQEAYGAR